MNQINQTNHSSEYARWAQCSIPGFLLVLVPKCPLCIVAYATMFTGVRMSFALAAHVRVGMIVVCVAAVVYLVGRQYVKKFKVK